MLAASPVCEPDKMQEDMSNVSRDKNSKKEPRKKDARDQSHCNRNEECL